MIQIAPSSFSSSSSLSVARVGFLFLTCAALFADVTATLLPEEAGGSSNNKKGIRGSSSSSSTATTTASSKPRSLIALDEMVCEPTDDNVGSVMCNFRVIPPTEPTTTNQYKNCLNSENTLGGEICITSKVVFVASSGNGSGGSSHGGSSSFSSSSSSSSEGTTTVLVPPPTNVNNNNNNNGATTGTMTRPSPPPPSKQSGGSSVYEQKCPRFKPESGTQCGGWIPSGSSTGACPYGSDVCHCYNFAAKINDDVNVNPKYVVWDCGDVDLDTRIDVELNSGAAIPEPTMPPTRPIPMSSSTIDVPRPINNGSCPKTKPNDGDACQWQSRCGYWDQDPNPTKIIDCRCDTYSHFRCNDAVSDIYQYYSSSAF